MNATSQFERATVTVAYVNPPKPPRKSGSIKTVEGEYFSVWPNMLNQFQQGETYEVEFTETDKNGAIFRDVKKAWPKQPSRAIQGEFDAIGYAPARNGATLTPSADHEPRVQHGSHVGTRKEYWQPKPTDPGTSRRIFICGLVNAWAHNGRIDMSVEAVSEAVRIAGEAYDQMLGEG